MIDNELISVIIPVYNVEDYLERCINSVLKQSYKNLEIILVDDGSTDNSGKICDEYTKKDSRIKVIHKVNGGLSDARNKGFDIATGIYIAFIDSDDFVTYDYIQYMYENLVKNGAELSISGIRNVWKEEDIKEDIHINTQIMSSEETFENLLFDKGISISAYGKLYHRNLLENNKFPKGKVYEDTAIMYKIIYEAKKIVYGNKKCYYYVARAGSISKQKGYNKNEEDYIVHTKQMLEFIQKEYPELKMAVNRFDVYSKLRILRMLIYTKPRNRKMENEYVKYIKKYQKDVFKCKDTPRRDKVAIIFLNLGMPFFKVMWTVYCKVTNRI